MKFRSREINVFSMSALDLFASALGAFILISMVLMPYFLRVDPEEVNRLRKDLREAQAQLRNCQQELHTCKRRLSKTFLAMVVQWPTRRHDVDLHVIDVAGREFSYRKKRIPGRPGELSADTTKGPGVEIWEVPEAPPGEYRVLYNLYSRGRPRNPAPAIVKGGVYHRDGHDRFRERRLTAVGRGNALLIAVVTVKPDGSVDISER